MKQKLLILLVTILLVVIAPLSVTAAPFEGLDGLTQYFPEDTILLFAMGINDARISELDALIAKFSDEMPGVVPPMGITDMLDFAMMQGTGDSFTNSVDPWLGDHVAIGLLDMDFVVDGMMNPNLQTSDVPLVIAISITDYVKAVSFVDKRLATAFPPDSFTVTPTDDFIRYDFNGSRGNEVSMAIGSDVMIIGTTSGVDNMSVDGRLDQNPSFTKSFDLLPADSYLALYYMNYEKYRNLQIEISKSIMPGLEMPELFYPGIVMGLSVTDRAIIMDMAAAIGDDIEPNGDAFGLYNALPPIDSDFAALMPADTVFMLHGSDLNAIYKMLDLAVLELQKQMTQMMQIMATQPEMSDSDFTPEMILSELEKGNAKFNAEITQYTGLTFPDDFVSWMDGNYVLFVSLSPEVFTNPMAWEDFVSVGVAIEASDSEKAANLVNGIRQAFNISIKETGNDTVDITDETIGNGQAVVATELATGFELVIGASDDLFTFGTRTAVEEVLNPTGERFTDTDKYARYQEFLIEKSTMVGYFDMGILVQLAGMNPSPSEAEMLAAIFGLFDNITVSGTTDVAHNSIARMALVFSE